MSDPQTEDGYTRIANELLDAILRYPFSKRELNIVLAVIRKTYGFNKKADDMTLTQLADLTGMHLPHVSEAVAALSGKNVLLKREGKYGYVLGLNKKHSTWNAYRNGNVTETVSGGYRNGNNGLPKREHSVTETVNTKDNPKRQPQKTIPKAREHAPVPGLDPEVWSMWFEYRKEIKKPIREPSIEKAQKKLASFGSDQRAVVENSIAEGYQGLFPLKNNQRNSQPPVKVKEFPRAKR